MFNALGGFNNLSFDSVASGIRVVERSLEVEANELVLLSSIPEFSSGSTIIWSQVAGEKVDIQNPTQKDAHFTSVSNFNHESVLVFRVAEINGSNISADYNYVTVRRSDSPSRRITNILNKARITLGDKKKERYTDLDLLLILDEGQKDFAKQTNILKSVIELQPTQGQVFATIPDDCYRITRATKDGTKFPMLTYDDVDHIICNVSFMDDYFNISSGWESEYGEVQALIYDKSNIDKIRLYPIPEITDNDLSSDFGVLTSVDQLVNDGSVSSQYGVVSNFSEASGIIRLYCCNLPSEVTQVTDVLDIPPMFDEALKYYVIAHSFLNDLDSGWQEKGLQQLRFYEREVEKAQANTSNNHVNLGDSTTNYRSPFK